MEVSVANLSWTWLRLNCAFPQSSHGCEFWCDAIDLGSLAESTAAATTRHATITNTNRPEYHISIEGINKFIKRTAKGIILLVFRGAVNSSWHLFGTFSFYFLASGKYLPFNYNIIQLFLPKLKRLLWCCPESYTVQKEKKNSRFYLQSIISFTLLLRRWCLLVIRGGCCWIGRGFGRVSGWLL